VKKVKKKKPRVPIKPPWNTRQSRFGYEPVPENHHIIPRSRQGNFTDNILTNFPSDRHWAWHRLFGNLLPMEIMLVILRYMLKPGNFRQWPNIVEKGKEPPKPVNPDQIILEMTKKVFPKDWVPGNKLMSELNRRQNQGKS